MRWWLPPSLAAAVVAAGAALGVSEARRISRGRRWVERFGLVAAAAKPGFGDCYKVQQQAQG